MVKIIRGFLESNDFMEIHSPKLISTASEGGANVFEVKYFDKPAYLAQSPQFYKQMAICADFKRVYEVGPVFRAENSFTHRHLTEFTGVDLEMEIKENYEEVLDMFDGLFTHLFSSLQSISDIVAFNTQFGVEPFEFCTPSIRITFKEAVQMLKMPDSKWMISMISIRLKKKLLERSSRTSTILISSW